MTPQEAHLIKRLVAFFATGDNVVAHNLAVEIQKRGEPIPLRLHTL